MLRHQTQGSTAGPLHKAETIFGCSIGCGRCAQCRRQRVQHRRSKRRHKKGAVARARSQGRDTAGTATSLRCGSTQGKVSQRAGSSSLTQAAIGDRRTSRSPTERAAWMKSGLRGLPCQRTRQEGWAMERWAMPSWTETVAGRTPEQMGQQPLQCTCATRWESSLALSPLDCFGQAILW